MDNLNNTRNIFFLEKTLYNDNEILNNIKNELYFRFITQIITYYYYLMK